MSECVVCCCTASKPRSQLLGQLPTDRLNSGYVFHQVGVDYAGPKMVKSSSPYKPFITKTHVCVFMSFTVKAIHLEPILELNTATIIATLRRFVARHEKPIVIWSDHGTNFVGAAKEIKELYTLLRKDETNDQITDFCSAQNIQWCYIPKHAPHFGRRN